MSIGWIISAFSRRGRRHTSEYCDNIAIERGWCRFEKTQIQPTHSWYVGYAPADDPEIVVSAFIFNGGEGSRWAAPVACNVMAAYFRVGQYAPRVETEEGETAVEIERACNSLTHNVELTDEFWAGLPD